MPTLYIQIEKLYIEKSFFIIMLSCIMYLFVQYSSIYSLSSPLVTVISKIFQNSVPTFNFIVMLSCILYLFVHDSSNYSIFFLTLNVYANFFFKILYLHLLMDNVCLQFLTSKINKP